MGFSIGKIASLPELTKALNLDLTQMLGKIDGLSADLSKNIASLFNGVANSHSNGASPKLAVSPHLMATILSSVHKLAFIAVLQSAMDKAAASQHFNLETAINDLWVKLSGIRDLGSENGDVKLKTMIQKRKELFELLSSVINKYNESAKGVVSKIGR